ncbi:MAG: RICIN domain-containing protein, partial [Oscillospiraceae bacterium]|nr:RICIN domain-containing protein [Oscillospiraceae bacterium]
MNKRTNRIEKQVQRLLSVMTALLLTLSLVLVGFTYDTASASSVDYPVVFLRISTYDNSRNVNITGTSDKSAVNTWTGNGGMNENWRFDLVGSDANGNCYQIVNQDSGRLLTPMLFSGDEGTQVVIYGKTDEKAQQWYVTPVQQDKYGNDLYYKITNCASPDMALTYFGESDIRLSKYSGSNAQKWLLNAAGLQGFAGYCKTQNGSAKASSIGGTLGKTVEVKTFDELKNACTSTEPLTIIVTGKISGKTGSKNYEISTGHDGGKRYYCRDNYIYLQPNKTIIGSYSANSLYNVYFRTYNEQWGPAHNVIIRNIDCTHDTELNTDNIWEFAYGWNFWIDHCNLQGHQKIETSSLKSDDWDKLLNFKGSADYITISDCRFGHHEYGVLLGYPVDDEASYKTYNGTPCATLTNNYYRDTVTRAPGLMRYGYFHSYNNYVINFDMGYTIYTACKLYSESNYFEAGT